MGRLLRVAAVCRNAIRKKLAVRTTIAASLVALGAILPLLPLMTAKTISFEVARSVCSENVWATSVEISSGMDDEAAAEFLEFHKSNAANYANSWFPFGFKTASAWFSLACFLLWMFFTPHTSSSETRLDLQRALLSSHTPLSLYPPPPIHRNVKET